LLGNGLKKTFYIQLKTSRNCRSAFWLLDRSIGITICCGFIYRDDPDGYRKGRFFNLDDQIILNNCKEG